MLHHPRDAVRIQVQKFGGAGAPASSRKFSVDPSLTSLEVLQSILTRAFDVKGDYALSYLAVDDTGEQTYLPLLTDWDLEAAFTSASEPCLHLILNARSKRTDGAGDNDVVEDDEPRSNCNLALNSAEWDVVHSIELPQPVAEVTTSSSPFLKGQDYLNASVGIPADPENFPSSPRQLGNKLPGFIKNRVEKTYNNIVQGLNKAFSLVELDPLAIGGAPLNFLPSNTKEPLSDAEFHSFLDPVGCLVHAKELRHAVFWGGIESSLRKVVWKHILNIYPEGMPGRQRMHYIKSLSAQYESMRAEWKSIVDISANVATPPASTASTAHDRATALDQIVIVANMVRKDVYRTDRTHPFFAGPDDNPNTASLFNILTTFALNHPSVGYCQGMSDIAAPLLFVMRDEAQAYICFCALMRRLKPNFSPDGVQMAQLFAHLSRAVSAYDPRFYQYLCDQQADDLLFCYRWLLLELKREFCFEDALRMLEVSWSSFPDWNGPQPPSCVSSAGTVTTSDGSGSDTPSSASGDAQAFLPLFEKRFCVVPGNLPIEPSSSLAAAASATATFFDRKQTAYARVRAMRRQSTHGATVASLRMNNYRNQYQPQVSLQERNRKTASFESSASSLEILATGEFECAGTARTLSTCSSSVAHAAAGNFIFSNGLSAPPSSSSPEIVSSSEVLSYSPYEIIPSPLPYPASVEIGSEAEPSSPSPPPPPPPPPPGAAKLVRNLKEFHKLAKGKTEEELTNSSTSSTASSSSGRGFDASCESNSSSVAQGRKKVLKISGKSNGRMFAISDDEDGDPGGQLKTIDERKQGSKKKEAAKRLDVGNGEATSSAASPSSSDSGLDDEDRAALIFSQNSCEEVTEATKMLPSASTAAKLLNSVPASLLPPPDKLGCGHPFLVFLCVTLLLQHRDPVMKRGMDYNELAMYFDKMVRRHDVNRVLNQARGMYEQYLSYFASIGQTQAASSSGASTACELGTFQTRC